MASYLVLNATFARANGEASGGKLHEAGTVIEFDGTPGTSLWPLDAEAFTAKKAFLRAERNKHQRERDGLIARGYVANFPPRLRAKAEEAEKRHGSPWDLSKSTR